MSADLSREQILQTVAQLVREVIGESWVESVNISETTSFNDELELESIEFVALAEKLQEHYGKQVNFVGWLSGKELDEIITLTVGDLVGFIASSR
ncbi:MAG: hypothetical protein A2289_05535 [Deltaproteobacteria bacterium RIFOXYA12_FULL_58_15]|nr:MAG: hypothetical protein A2289_05535 [Deltaproteobacteria bacterium RIFOXYA12_FULL_58_15]OGR12193.1 MAG: hypothetical protein A2341_12540 [Deltaproteobacteria bacterium RIFOXYB12_FULL_58_9]